MPNLYLQYFSSFNQKESKMYKNRISRNTKRNEEMLMATELIGICL